MKSRVHNPKYLEKYFTQFPNIIDDSDLTPFEFRLLIHYYRVGECWEGVRKTAQICKMSTGKVATSRLSLEQKGFIRIEEKGDGIIIFLEDLSRKNLEKYSPEGVHHMDSSVHHMDDGCPPHEHKKNQSKKNQLRTIESKDSVTLFPEATADKSIYTRCVDIWLKEIHPMWSFKSIDGKAMKSIIEQMREYSKKKNEIDPTDDRMVDFFRHLMISLPVFYKNQTLTVISSKFDSIIDEIRTGQSSKKISPREFINRL